VPKLEKLSGWELLDFKQIAEFWGIYLLFHFELAVLILFKMRRSSVESGATEPLGEF
jgi:hypothetical protein